MKVPYFTILWVVSLILGLGNGEESDNHQIKTKIVGGIETKHHEYPFIVSLFRRSLPAGHFCGGSIIDKQWVLTAAHCVKSDQGNTRTDFQLVGGDHDLRVQEGDEQTVSVEQVIPHPEYNPRTFENDIALIKVTPAFNYTTSVKSFQLPSPHFVAAGNVTTAGWGVMAEGSQEGSPVLMKVTIEVIPNIDCAKMYGKGFHLDKMICAGAESGGKDACQGDSGGPLLCYDARFGDTQCGVVSYGFGCARKEYAGVYTKVAYYSDWIKDQMKTGGSGTTTTTTIKPTTKKWWKKVLRRDRNSGHRTTGIMNLAVLSGLAFVLTYDFVLRIF